MVSYGYIAPRSAGSYASAVISQPTTTTTAPPRTTTTTQNVAPPRGVPVPQPISTAQPIAGGPVIITDPGLGQNLPTTTPTTTTTTTTGGGGTGSGGGTGDQNGGPSDTSRLIDLIAGAFQPQDVQQPFGPQTVQSSGAAVDSGSSGTNPMAVLVLAILAIVGVVWYTHRKASRRAA